jgi:hypothetical protein
MYFSLFGKDLKPGETGRARTRLVITTDPSGWGVENAYSTFLRQSR